MKTSSLGELDRRKASSIDADPIPLLALPTAMAERIAPKFVIVFNPNTGARLQLARSAYDLLQQFCRPALLKEVLPPELRRRERARECVRKLREKGLLVPADIDDQPFGAPRTGVIEADLETARSHGSS